jgi:hypothetical protein
MWVARVVLTQIKYWPLRPNAISFREPLLAFVVAVTVADVGVPPVPAIAV